jgi:ABC-type multidrug transport system ATPase subunit
LCRKTTLLDVLAGRANAGVRQGSVFLNGELQSGAGLPRCSGGSVKAAYVWQQDTHNPLLTVRETLSFAAMLRLKSSQLDSAAVRSRVVSLVDAAASLLSLSGVLDRLVGPPSAPNITGCQVRLLSIGVEVVDNPALIFLDEPTTG